MKVAVLSPIAWRTPPVKYGPWEKVASLIAEGMVAMGVDVTLFATADSHTSGTLAACCPRPYEEDRNMDPKVWECLHISYLMEQAHKFDIIHNHYDFLPLTYSRLIKTPVLTTIHGFSSEKIVPVYKKYNNSSTYVSISDSDRHPDLSYHSTIYHGIEVKNYPYREKKDNYLLFFGRIHPDKGTHEAIRIASQCNRPLLIAGFIQDQGYYEREVAPFIDGEQVKYLGNVGQKEGADLLGRASALLHPIAFREPFGLSVVEAMMCGTPVIAYNKGSMPELIIHGKTGFLVNTAREAASAVANLSGIRPIDCRTHAENRFSIKTMVNAYLNAYKDVLHKSIHASAL